MHSPAKMTADSRSLTTGNDAKRIVNLLAAPRFDSREVLDIGRRLFAIGGFEPLETIIDQVSSRLGNGVAYELVMIWMSVVENEDEDAELAA
jgi:hypothetical protein